jgi:hypothetical protein
MVAFPTGDYYHPPIADLHRAAFGVSFAGLYDDSIADSGSTRYFLRVGGAFGLVRWTTERAAAEGPPEEAPVPGPGLQLDLVAGMDGQFDLDHSLDNIGWDGNYGLQVTSALNARLALKLALVHTSSHVGDELAERTGLRRIGYSRDELALGVRRELGSELSLYGEAAYGYDINNPGLQEPLRFQTGVDFDPARAPGGPRTAWFFGVDLSAMEERDYRVDGAVKAGRAFHVEDRYWRLGVELYDGRPNMGEFFADDEAHVALGVWLDF